MTCPVHRLVGSALIGLLLLPAVTPACPPGPVRIVLIRSVAPAATGPTATTRALPVPAPRSAVPATVRPSPDNPPLLAGVLTAAAYFETFQPRPGRHEATLLHPITGQPIPVRFVLPAGKHPRRGILRATSFEFDYGTDSILIEFLRNGQVRVEY